MEGLDEAIQKDAVKATVMPTNAILVVVLPSWDALYCPAGGWDIKGEALGWLEFLARL